MALLPRHEVIVDTATGAEIRGDVAFTFQDVVIQSRGVELEARLYLPAGRRPPLPAVVVNHGSAPTTYADVSFFSQTALELGMAALAYSKRGCGASTGEYRPFSVADSEAIFDELAADAVAALTWLKERSEVDAGRVGFLGGSQAGWISPLAAAQKPAAFVVNVAGVPLSAGEEHHHGQLVGDGDPSRGTVPVEEADRRLGAWNGPRGYDPRPVLAGLEVPTLWLFGSADTVIPVRPSLAVLEELAGENPVHEAELLDGYDHNMSHRETGEAFDLEQRLRQWLGGLGVLVPSG